MWRACDANIAKDVTSHRHVRRGSAVCRELRADLGMAVTPRRFPPPWFIEEARHDQALAVEIGYWFAEGNCSGRSLPAPGFPDKISGVHHHVHSFGWEKSKEAV
jgi:hypothetical protein